MLAICGIFAKIKLIYWGAVKTKPAQNHEYFPRALLLAAIVSASTMWPTISLCVSDELNVFTWTIALSWNKTSCFGRIIIYSVADFIIFLFVTYTNIYIDSEFRGEI